MREKIVFKVISYILTFVLVCQLVPGQVYASAFSGSGDSGVEAPAEQRPVTVLGENEKLREESVKHFFLSDGSSVKVSVSTSPSCFSIAVGASSDKFAVAFGQSYYSQVR